MQARHGEGGVVVKGVGEAAGGEGVAVGLLVGEGGMCSDWQQSLSGGSRQGRSVLAGEVCDLAVERELQRTHGESGDVGAEPRHDLRGQGGDAVRVVGGVAAQREAAL